MTSSVERPEWPMSVADTHQTEESPRIVAIAAKDIQEEVSLDARGAQSSLEAQGKADRNPDMWGAWMREPREDASGPLERSNMPSPLDKLERSDVPSLKAYFETLRQDPNDPSYEMTTHPDGRKVTLSPPLDGDFSVRETIVSGGPYSDFYKWDVVRPQTEQDRIMVVKQ